MIQQELNSSSDWFTLKHKQKYGCCRELHGGMGSSLKFHTGKSNVFLFYFYFFINPLPVFPTRRPPVALCTHNGAHWLGFIWCTYPDIKKKKKKSWEGEIFPCHNGIECGSPEEEGLRGLCGSVGAVLCGEWIQQVPTESQPRDRHSVARDNVASQQLNSGGFGVV